MLKCPLTLSLFILGNCLAFATGEWTADQKADLGTLKFVHALWRHGARTPTTEMGKEPMNWEQGPGELTAKGIGQMYRLGQWIRQRYDGFLPSEFNPFDVYVRSSDFNRTLMSAQAVLAGLYPPAEQKWAPNINWRPIPVHTESRLSDRVIFDGSDCAPMAAEEYRVFNGTRAMAIADENGAFLRFLSSQSGFAQSPLPLREMRYVFDPINCRQQNGEGRQPPKWANYTVSQHIRQLYDQSSALMFSTTALVRFKAGVLFTEILKRMKAVESRQKHDQRQRLHAYSAHDTTVAGLLAAFGIHPFQFPRFAVLLLVELHHHPLNSSSSTAPNSADFVRFFYKNETDSDSLWEWPIPECPAPCTLAQLERAKAEIMSSKEEQDRECGKSDTSFILGIPATRIYIALIGALSLLSASLLLCILCGSISQNRRRKEKHRNRTLKWTSGNSEDTEKLMMEEVGEENEEESRDENRDGDE